jgi:hypothetical protein
MLTQILTLIRIKQRDMNPYPVFVLLPSFTTNILAKFVVGTSFCTKAERQRRDIVSCLVVFFWIRARIRVSIHKQRHMGRHVERPPVTSNSVCMRKIMCRRQKLSSMPSSSYFVVLLKLSIMGKGEIEGKN